MANVITFGSYKGGPGKTTLAASFCAYLANHGKHVVGIDCDEQAHLAKWAIKRKETARWSEDEIKPVEVISLEPSTELNTIAAEVADKALLMTTVDEIFGRDSEAVVVIDCPGQLSNFVVDAHCMADIVVTPVDITSPNAITDLTSDYYSGIEIWRKKFSEYDVPAPFEWRVVPNKVPYNDNGTIPPYHYTNLETLKKFERKLGFTLTPNLPLELAYAPAMDQGLSFFDPVMVQWLRGGAVNRFDATEAENVLRSVMFAAQMIFPNQRRGAVERTA